MHVHSRRPTKKLVAKTCGMTRNSGASGQSAGMSSTRGPETGVHLRETTILCEQAPSVVTDSAGRLTPSSRSPLSARGRTLKASGRGGRSGTASWLYGIRTGCQRNGRELSAVRLRLSRKLFMNRDELKRY